MKLRKRGSALLLALMLSLSLSVSAMAEETVASLEETSETDWLFVDAKTAMQEYPLPSAFRAYTSYVNILPGTFRGREM